jgi:hypothetical protein
MLSVPPEWANDSDAIAAKAAAMMVFFMLSPDFAPEGGRVTP